MSIERKIDFVMYVSATNCNPNGDPLDGNRPRINYDGLGEISDVCIKRKIRNRMQDLGNCVFVQSSDRADDGQKSLSDRSKLVKGSSNEDYADKACEKWLDVRSFGQVFAFKGSKDAASVSVGVRGPVSIHQAVSCNAVDINSMQITKSVNSETKEGKSSDTMGTKHMVRFGLYKIKGSINVQLAEKTGFSNDDAETIKECLRTLFVNDASSARPDGSLEVVKLFWFKHNCKDGQYSSFKVHNSVNYNVKDGVDFPKSIEDFELSKHYLDNLEVEEINGL